MHLRGLENVLHDNEELVQFWHPACITASASFDAAKAMAADFCFTSRLALIYGVNQLAQHACMHGEMGGIASILHE